MCPWPHFSCWNTRVSYRSLVIFLYFPESSCEGFFFPKELLPNSTFHFTYIFHITYIIYINFKHHHMHQSTSPTSLLYLGHHLHHLHLHLHHTIYIYISTTSISTSSTSTSSPSSTSSTYIIYIICRGVVTWELSYNTGVVTQKLSYRSCYIGVNFQVIQMYLNSYKTPTSQEFLNVSFGGRGSHTTAYETWPSAEIVHVGRTNVVKREFVLLVACAGGTLCAERTCRTHKHVAKPIFLFAASPFRTNWWSSKTAVKLQFWKSRF